MRINVFSLFLHQRELGQSSSLSLTYSGRVSPTRSNNHTGTWPLIKSQVENSWGDFLERFHHSYWWVSITTQEQAGGTHGGSLHKKLSHITVMSWTWLRFPIPYLVLLSWRPLLSLFLFHVHPGTWTDMKTCTRNIICVWIGNKDGCEKLKSQKNMSETERKQTLR